MSGTDRVLPPGQKMPRLAKIRITVGKPLTFEQYRDLPSPARQRRAITDEVMRSIQALSGQEYVPVYASVRKEELAAARNGARPGPGQPPGAGLVARGGTLGKASVFALGFHTKIGPASGSEPSSGAEPFSGGGLVAASSSVRSAAGPPD